MVEAVYRPTNNVSIETRNVILKEFFLEATMPVENKETAIN